MLQRSWMGALLLAFEAYQKVPWACSWSVHCVGHQPPVGAVPSLGPQFYQMGTPLRQHHKNPFKFRMCSCFASGVAQQMEFTRAMLQAQDEQIRQQAAQLQQMSAMLTGGDPSAASANASTPVDMEVDSGVRNKREGNIPQLPQLNYVCVHDEYVLKSEFGQLTETNLQAGFVCLTTATLRSCRRRLVAMWKFCK